MKSKRILLLVLPKASPAKLVMLLDSNTSPIDVQLLNAFELIVVTLARIVKDSIAVEVKASFPMLFKPLWIVKVFND